MKVTTYSSLNRIPSDPAAIPEYYQGNTQNSLVMRLPKLEAPQVVLVHSDVLLASAAITKIYVITKDISAVLSSLLTFILNNSKSLVSLKMHSLRSRFVGRFNIFSTIGKRVSRGTFTFSSKFSAMPLRASISASISTLRLALSGTPGSMSLTITLGDSDCIRCSSKLSAITTPSSSKD